MYLKKYFCVTILSVFLIALLLPLVLFAQDNELIQPDVYTFPIGLITAVGLVAPFLINLVNKGVKESWLRFLIALFLSMVIAFIGIIVTKIPITLGNIGVVLTAFFTLTTVSWKLWWHAALKKG